MGSRIGRHFGVEKGLLNVLIGLGVESKEERCPGGDSLPASSRTQGDQHLQKLNSRDDKAFSPYFPALCGVA